MEAATGEELKDLHLMETVEGFSEFLRKIGAPNFLAVGLVILVLWLLLSGVIRGLRKKGDHEDEEK